jgi:Zn-dependent peptidase ImmA (M78 family)
MKIPRSINIFGKDCKIVKVKDLVKKHEAYGRFKHSNFTIELDSKISGELLRVTFLHELLHAVFERLMLNDDFDEKTEEKLCDQIATFLAENFIIYLKKA